jgi:hypothetical protein
VSNLSEKHRDHVCLMLRNRDPSFFNREIDLQDVKQKLVLEMDGGGEDVRFRTITTRPIFELLNKGT